MYQIIRLLNPPPYLFLINHNTLERTKDHVIKSDNYTQQNEKPINMQVILH